jgi:CBS domain-containing protein
VNCPVNGHGAWRKAVAGGCNMKTVRAAEIMTQPVVTIRPEASLLAAIKLLLRHHISGLPVVDAAGGLVGLITERDIMNFALSGDAAESTVADAMTTEVISFSPDAELATLANCFIAKGIRRVPIVEGTRVLGIVSRRDILREILFFYD